jgi:hypothetical protein
MVCKFTKADEGKYFLGTIICDKKYHGYIYLYVLKITQVAVYRRCSIIKEAIDIFMPFLEEKIVDAKVESLLEWKLEVSKISDNSLPDNTTECYPLELVVLGLFRSPRKALTKKERQQIKDFESQLASCR